MNRNYRLRGSTNFKRVRQQGIATAHPLFVLIYSQNSIGRVRVGVSAGRSIGNAVQRNRAKRRLRAAIQPFLDYLQAGVDLVLLARKPLLQAPFSQIIKAMEKILEDQRLIGEPTHETQTASPRHPSGTGFTRFGNQT
ncbi:MAG: ribonuclease P protein component [Anaerolineae bacterium]|nr:MAG: ribonuclease P protein component [Anaerolineae bacterium]